MCNGDNASQVQFLKVPKFATDEQLLLFRWRWSFQMTL